MTAQSLNEVQDQAESLDLLYAADVAHRSAQLAEAARGLLVSVMAGLSILAAAWHSAANAVAIAGVFVAIATEVFWPFVSRHATTRAALIQETFDTTVFGLDWNPELGSPLPVANVVKLARKYKRDTDKHRWYVDVSGLPRPLAVMICQRQNLMWDADLRTLWARILITGLSAWIAIGTITSLIADWTVRDLVVRWLAPSLALILYAGRLAWAHWSIAVNKSGLRQEVDAQLAQLTVPAAVAESNRLMDEARRRQNAIFALRDRMERVPQRLYEKHRAEDQDAHERDAEAIRQRLLR